MSVKPLLAATALMLACFQPSTAADLIYPIPGTQDAASDPGPVPNAPPPAMAEQRGIWAAIAYSQTDSKHGFFWGGDKRDEAEKIALKHCERAGGEACAIVTTFRNHRHWNDDDGSGFPYFHCGALAVSKEPAAGTLAWGATSALTRKEAQDLSLQACQVSGKQCEIREWVCT